MNYPGVSVELRVSSEARETDVRKLADLLREKVVRAALDFKESHRFPPGVNMVLNGEVQENRDTVPALVGFGKPAPPPYKYASIGNGIFCRVGRKVARS